MLEILSETIEDGFLIRNYTRDGINISHTVKQVISEEIEPVELPEPTEPRPTIEQQILAENQYQTALLEMQMLGGM